MLTMCLVSWYDCRRWLEVVQSLHWNEAAQDGNDQTSCPNAEYWEAGSTGPLMAFARGRGKYP